MSALRRKLAPPAVVLLAALTVAGCGGTHSNSERKSAAAAAAAASSVHGVQMFPAVLPQGKDGQAALVHVGSTPITVAEFSHWDEALTPRIAPYEPKSRVDCSSVRAASEVKLSARQKAAKLSAAQIQALCVRQKQAEVKVAALQQLISNRWVLGEAAELGLGVSDGEAQKQMEKEVLLAFKSKAKFMSYLASAGRTVADSLEGVRVYMSNKRIQEMIERKAKAKIDENAIARYYHEHEKSFSAPQAQGETTPSRPKSLREVESTVREKLSKELIQREMASFIRAFRAKWLARTSCTPGYVVSRCREYRGPNKLANEESFGVG